MSDWFQINQGSKSHYADKGGWWPEENYTLSVRVANNPILVNLENIDLNI